MCINSVYQTVNQVADSRWKKQYYIDLMRSFSPNYKLQEENTSMGILLALIAGFFNSSTNFCVKKGVSIGNSANPFFLCQMFASTLFALLLGPILKQDFSLPLYPSLLGICAGVILYVMLLSLGLALKAEVPGLTFAILNSATMLPGIAMAWLFGDACGFSVSLGHIFGLLLMTVGLFWGIVGVEQVKKKENWMLFSTMVFLFHALLLSLFHYRAILVKMFHLTEFNSEWFAPLMFFTCFCIQLVTYLCADRRVPSSAELMVGFAGGLTNLLCTLSLLLAAEKAQPFENVVIFPITSVACIALTNVWSQKIYFEQVNWRACQLSAIGIVIGSINWEQIFCKLLGSLCL